MSFKVGSTTVFDNSGNLPVAQVALPSGVIKSLSVGTVGDGTNARGTAACVCTAAIFTSGTGNLSVNFDTNCACACVCVCNCNCDICTG